MVSMLIDTGALHQENGHWVAAAASQIAVPPTIHALLAARFDSLGVGEKQVLEPASVIGLLFPVAAVSELIADAARPTLETTLGVLNRKQFVLPDTVDEDDADAARELLDDCPPLRLRHLPLAEFDPIGHIDAEEHQSADSAGRVARRFDRDR